MCLNTWALGSDNVFMVDPASFSLWPRAAHGAAWFWAVSGIWTLGHNYSLSFQLPCVVLLVFVCTLYFLGFSSFTGDSHIGRV